MSFIFFFCQMDITCQYYSTLQIKWPNCIYDVSIILGSLYMLGLHILSPLKLGFWNSFDCKLLDFWFGLVWFFNTGFLCIAMGCPGTSSVNQAGFKLTEIPCLCHTGTGIKGVCLARDPFLFPCPCNILCLFLLPWYLCLIHTETPHVLEVSLAPYQLPSKAIIPLSFPCSFSFHGHWRVS